jgi:hypothetical protein
MSREEHLRELVRQGQALCQEDIDLGAKQERERIINHLQDVVNNYRQQLKDKNHAEWTLATYKTDLIELVIKTIREMD